MVRALLVTTVVLFNYVEPAITDESGVPLPPNIRKALITIWRTPGLNRVLRTMLARAPHGVRRWLERERTRVRTMELEARIHARPRLVPVPELRKVLHAGLQVLTDRYGRERIGDYLEFGVYNGTSLTCMYRELQASHLQHVRLFGFDSFQGFPAHAAQEDEGRWRPGRCHSPFEFTTAVLEAEGIDWRRVTLLPGWFAETLTPDTIERHQIVKASVIMIDCDLYSSTKEALTFCAPLIVDEALILFDEWNARGFDGKVLGERKAFGEFLAEWGCFRATPFRSYAARAHTFLVSRIHR